MAQLLKGSVKQLRLDLQAKILLLLISVIVPTFLLVLLAENHLTRPLLEDEIRQTGINVGKTLAAEIVGNRLLQRTDSVLQIENTIRTTLYAFPNVVQIDVFSRDPLNGALRFVVSSVEDEPGVTPIAPEDANTIHAERGVHELGFPVWKIVVPIESVTKDRNGLKRNYGAVQIVESIKLVETVSGILWKLKIAGALVSVLVLITVLSYFLRRVIFTDRKLKKAQSQKLKLESQLHEAERALLTSEKFAVMGQLTGSFAHEIGTPLNAIGGHLQLLREDSKDPRFSERLEIIQTQVERITQTVKNFLQTTSKPQSQTQLVDPNVLIERTILTLRPRIQAAQVNVIRNLERNLPPVRVAPIELEQIFLNLASNALDSLLEKNGTRDLTFRTRLIEKEGESFAEIRVKDSGVGIKKADLGMVLKPFFTTKPPGVGTGLGLAICQELVKKMRGTLEIDSREGAWTEVRVEIPYRNQ